jgi:hypothetical protein
MDVKQEEEVKERIKGGVMYTSNERWLCSGIAHFLLLTSVSSARLLEQSGVEPTFIISTNKVPRLTWVRSCSIRPVPLPHQLPLALS